MLAVSQIKLMQLKVQVINKVQKLTVLLIILACLNIIVKSLILSLFVAYLGCYILRIVNILLKKEQYFVEKEIANLDDIHKYWLENNI